MIPALSSELRKIFTVRSTYVILGVALTLSALVHFYIFGYRVPFNVQDPGFLASAVARSMDIVALLIALIGVLLVTHEYRYNTIMYTLTSGRNRLVVLAAKFLVISVLSILLSLFFSLLAPVLTMLGVLSGGHDIAAQSIPWADLLWRSVFMGWGYSMLALMIAVLIRHQVGTIVFLLFVPGMIEGILSLLLKENARYLPFSVLQSVLQPSDLVPGKAAMIFLAYLVVGWVVAAVLFVRRDAN